MTRKLSSEEMALMYAQIESLSEDNLITLAENDPIINGKETEEEIKGVLGLNSEMQNYTNSLEVQLPISLEGSGIPDIVPTQLKAQNNAKIWRTQINPKISKNYTKALSLTDFLIVWGEDDIDYTVDSAFSSEAGKDDLLALMRAYSDDAKECSKNSEESSIVLNDFYSVFVQDGQAFQSLYNKIDKIYGDSSDKRAQLQADLEQYDKNITYYNVGIGIASGAIIGVTLGSVLFVALKSKLPSKKIAKIAGGTLSAVGSVSGVISELMELRNQDQEKRDKIANELNHISEQCTIAKLLNDNLAVSINLNGKITPKLGSLSRSWGTVSNKYDEIYRNIQKGLSSGLAILLKQRLKTAHKTALQLKPIIEQCEINQLLPVKVSDDLVDTLSLPRSWTNKFIASDIFFEYVYARRKI